MINNQIPTPDQFRTLIETAHEHSLRHGVTVYLLGRTGMFSAEAPHFQPDWFDSDTHSIFIPAAHDSWEPKATCRVRAIPVTPSIAQNISAYIDALSDDAFGVSTSAIHHRVTTAADSAALPHISPQNLRQMYAVRLRDSEVPEPQIAAILGTQHVTFLSESVSPQAPETKLQSIFDDSWVREDLEFPDDY